MARVERLRTRKGTACLLAALLLLAWMIPTASGLHPAQALPCNGSVLTVQSLGIVFYFEQRGGASLYVYRETGGEAGLQTGGTLLFFVDSCSDPDHPPDHLIAVVQLGS